MERGKSKGFASSIGDVIASDGAVPIDTGSTKAIGLTSERSVSWQQDMEQAIMPDMSWPQSM